MSDEAGGAVVVVGAPGSGKSTVGALLAQRLDLAFTDVDEVIADRAGKSIADIFTTDGEPAFRALEQATTLECLAAEGVVSLGGGAVTSAEIRNALNGQRVVWLRVKPATAAERIGLNEARPLLLGNVRGQLIRLMAERAPLYETVATISVDTDGLGPDEVAQAVAERLGRAPLG